MNVGDKCFRVYGKRMVVYEVREKVTDTLFIANRLYDTDGRNYKEETELRAFRHYTKVDDANTIEEFRYNYPEFFL